MGAFQKVPMGKPPLHRSRWAVDPNVLYVTENEGLVGDQEGALIKHLCEPRSTLTLCGLTVGEDWGRSVIALRCEKCVEMEDQL